MPPREKAALQSPFEHAQELIRQYRGGSGAEVRIRRFLVQCLLLLLSSITTRARRLPINLCGSPNSSVRLQTAVDVHELSPSAHLLAFPLVTSAGWPSRLVTSTRPVLAPPVRDGPGHTVNTHFLARTMVGVGQGEGSSYRFTR